MKKHVFLITIIGLLLLVLPLMVNAEIVDSGTCGEGVTWELENNGQLTISGEGSMNDFNAFSNNEWRFYRNSIRSVVIEGGVTNVGRYAFYDCQELASVSFSSGLTSIGNSAFYGCINMTNVFLPSTLINIDIIIL